MVFAHHAFEFFIHSSSKDLWLTWMSPEVKNLCDNKTILVLNHHTLDIIHMFFVVEIKSIFICTGIVTFVLEIDMFCPTNSHTNNYQTACVLYIEVHVVLCHRVPSIELFYAAVRTTTYFTVVIGVMVIFISSIEEC